MALVALVCERAASSSAEVVDRGGGEEGGGEDADASSREGITTPSSESGVLDDDALECIEAEEEEDADREDKEECGRWRLK